MTHGFDIDYVLQVHHYLLLLFAFSKLPAFIGMDDMCHWARFAASGDRAARSAKTREFVENVTKVGELSHLQILPGSGISANPTYILC